MFGCGHGIIIHQFGAFHSGSLIRKEREGVGHPANSIACISYVAGFVDGVNVHTGFAAYKMKQKMPKLFCLPEGVEDGQLVRIVLKFVRNNPEDAHRRTEVLIARALRESYLCQSK
jgi:hypothetical protein